MTKRMKHTCDQCLTYNKDGEYNCFCVVPGHCPGIEKNPEKRKYLYDRKYRNEIERLIGTSYARPGNLRGKVVDTVIKGIEYTGRFIYKHNNDLLFTTGSAMIHVDINDVTYIAERKNNG